MKTAPWAAAVTPQAVALRPAAIREVFRTYKNGLVPWFCMKMAL
jgi:hypothetical protein